jgi:uncharacterized membrane protein
MGRHFFPLFVVLSLASVACKPAGEPGNVVADKGETVQPEPTAPSQAVSEQPAGIPATSACLSEKGKAVPANALHAIGTEPFWAADVKGRCVTYSTPENQSGTRVWTHFAGSAEEGSWTGALEGRPFEMTTRREANCSDGMSDKAYPIAVTLKVHGETRRGCAEPRSTR